MEQGGGQGAKGGGGATPCKMLSGLGAQAIQQGTLSLLHKTSAICQHGSTGLIGSPMASSVFFSSLWYSLNSRGPLMQISPRGGLPLGSYLLA